MSLCEQGQNVTSVYAVSASGFHVPPMIVYPKKRMKGSLSFGATRGIFPLSRQKSWTESEVLCEWKRYFIVGVIPMPEEERF
jgi:hypothetical protein